MKYEISDRLATFIKQKMGEYNKPFNRDMTLEMDLGISGDKAIEFVDSFSDEFSITFPDNFNYSEHFDIEGLRFDFFNFFKHIFKKGTSETKKTVPITLGDLEDAIKRGVWEKKKLKYYPG